MQFFSYVFNYLIVTYNSHICLMQRANNHEKLNSTLIKFHTELCTFCLFGDMQFNSSAA